MRVVALVAAAGQGTRLGASVPKAFVPLRGRSLVERSVTAMIHSAVVDEIIVLVSPEMETFARTTLGELLDAEVPVRIIHGGGERADAARALTPPGMIARVARAVLAGLPAVIPVMPVADTIKRVDGDTVTDTPDRSTLRAVQTPQGFSLARLREANRRYFADPAPGFTATDDASLMEWAGVEVRTVQGDPMAFKVTTPIDMMLARTITDEAEPTIFEVPS